VIVVGPELRLHQCGLPKAMAVELFKPFISHKLVEKASAETVKAGQEDREREGPEVYENPGGSHPGPPVLAQPRPDLHRLASRRSSPSWSNGKGHPDSPLVCAAFNADFDGDQMAVHVPLSFEAQLEPGSSWSRPTTS